MFTNFNANTIKSKTESSGFKKPTVPKMPSRKVKSSNAKTVQPEPLPESTESSASEHEEIDDTIFTKEELNLSADEKSADEKSADETSADEKSVDNDDEDTDEQEDQQYEIESVHYHYPRKAKSADKCTHYSIKWVGYDITENTKETATKINELVPELVEEYWVKENESAVKKSAAKKSAVKKSTVKKSAEKKSAEKKSLGKKSAVIKKPADKKRKRGEEEVVEEVGQVDGTGDEALSGSPLESYSDMITAAHDIHEKAEKLKKQQHLFMVSMRDHADMPEHLSELIGEFIKKSLI